MDRIAQRLLIVALTIISGYAYGQCPDNYIRVDSDTIHHSRRTPYVCKKVVMSPDKFAYYYQTEKNLRAIEDSIPSLARNIENERSKSDSIKVNLEKSVEIANKQKALLRNSLNNCVETATELEVHNLYLHQALVRQRKITWIKGGAGVVLGIIIKSIL